MDGGLRIESQRIGVSKHIWEFTSSKLVKELPTFPRRQKKVEFLKTSASKNKKLRQYYWVMV